jgi:methylthioribulose-1-phosphate dehydratase
MSNHVSYTAKHAAFAQLREVKQYFSRKGWFPATSGNLSVKVEGTESIYAITASGKDKNIDTDEDFLLIDHEGRSIEETHLKPSAETLIHCELYRLTGCNAIFHVHTVFNNLVSELFAERGSILIQDIELIKAFNIWEEGASIEVPILPNYAEIPRIIPLIESAISPLVPGFVLRKHGVCAWGETVSAARRHVEAFEFLFEYLYRWEVIKK